MGTVAAFAANYLGPMFSGTLLLIELVLLVAYVAGLWAVFDKAGEPGWAAIVPFYNAYLICKIAGRPGWWWAVVFIPFVGGLIWLFLSLLVSLDMAANFGKSQGFGIGLWLLGFIFYPILGFGDASYGRRAQRATPSSAVDSSWTQSAASWNPSGMTVAPAWVAPSSPPPWSSSYTPPVPQYSPPAPAPQAAAPQQYAPPAPEVDPEPPYAPPAPQAAPPAPEAAPPEQYAQPAPQAAPPTPPSPPTPPGS